MHLLVLLRNNQHTKFELPSFTKSKDVVGPKYNNGSRDRDYAH